MGKWTYAWHPFGCLRRQTDANRNTITFTYDRLKRLAGKTYSNQTLNNDVRYTYDTAVNGVGRLRTVSTRNPAAPSGDYAETEYKRYDPDGRAQHILKTIRYQNTTRHYAFHYEYDLSGKPKNITYPDPDNTGGFTGDTVAFTYIPGANLISRVSRPDGSHYARFDTYTPSGKPGQIYYGNGTAKAYTYDPRSTRLLGYHSRLRDAGKPALQERTYTYTPAGDIRRITDIAAGKTYTYTYDHRHRLIKEAESGQTRGPSYTLSYNYGPSGIPHHAPQSVKLNHQGRNQNLACRYDANGNTLTNPDLTDPDNVGTRTITWNADNKPVTITVKTAAGTRTTRFLYDGEGARVAKSANGIVTRYAGDLFEETGNRPRMHIFGGNMRIATVTAGNIYYYHKDYLGSTVMTTDKNGNPTSDGRSGYLPFGLDRNPASRYVSHYRFTDQEQDTSTGLYNYDARLYDPGLRMFVSADTIVPYPFDPQSLNRYAYCRNNPIVYNDPSGHLFGFGGGDNQSIGGGGLFGGDGETFGGGLGGNNSEVTLGGNTMGNEFGGAGDGGVGEGGLNGFGVADGFGDGFSSQGLNSEAYGQLAGSLYGAYQSINHQGQPQAFGFLIPGLILLAESPAVVNTAMMVSVAIYYYSKPYLEAKKSKKSKKEKATDVPTWAKGKKPKPGESGNDFADRLCDEKYGKGNYPKGPGTEHGKIKKGGDRNKN